MELIALINFHNYMKIQSKRTVGLEPTTFSMGSTRHDSGNPILAKAYRLRTDFFLHFCLQFVSKLLVLSCRF